ncbi:regulatory protein RecX [Rubrobacter marinus]|uniref:regulatory protein RecX n=1 Tax=Rubrobacter marinus TaxID=2653852 RepID=UPI001D18F188|nr:regulatory protein RecX [Rubrobacter marinus]
MTGLVERRGRAKVFVDGEFWAVLDAAVAFDLGLAEGVELSDEGLREARVAGERPLAMTRALNVLGYRARAEGELRTRLERAGYADATVGAVLERLRELGYLDDGEFARNAAHEKSRKYGPRRILVDLKKSGVDEEVAREAVEEEFSGDDEIEAASAAAQRRYNTGERSDALARRVYGFLARRGYSAGVCAEVARRYREGGDGE